MALNQLTLSLQFARFDGVAEHRAALPRGQVTRWIRHALADDAEITVRIVDTEEGQALNREYRHRGRSAQHACDLQTQEIGCALRRDGGQHRLVHRGPQWQ